MRKSKLPDVKKKKSEQTIVKVIKNRNTSDIVNMPTQFRKTLLNSTGDNQKILDAPIHAMRILFKLLNDVSYLQYNPKRDPQQLKLFHNTFSTKNNIYCQFIYKVKEIDPNRNYDDLEDGLAFLDNLQRGWHRYYNHDNKRIKSYGGVIALPEIEKGEINFLVSSYWLDKLSNLTAYNTSLYKLAWSFSNTKQFLFYLWLLEVPSSGTTVRFDEFQKSFRLNYKTSKQFCQNVLLKIRAILDKESNLSFNYSTKGDYITIVPYLLNGHQLDVSSKTAFGIKVRAKLAYFQKRHQLAPLDVLHLKELIRNNKQIFDFISECYTAFVKDCKILEVKSSSFEGMNFLDQFQEIIIVKWLETSEGKINPSSYPRVVSR